MSAKEEEENKAPEESKEKEEEPSEAAEEEEESTAQFAPIVRTVVVEFYVSLSTEKSKEFVLSPLLFYSLFQVQLEQVDVETGEEDEEVLFTERAKLFVHGESMLNVGTGIKTWNERGIGQVRFLRNNEHQAIRILMRQEKTMKIICNHALDPRIKLEPNVGSDRSWVWIAHDFADGEELVETTFAIRFSDSEVAGGFKAKFLELQAEMENLLAGQDNPGEDGGQAADEAAEALAGLSTKDETAKEEEEAKEE
jgi:Ran-binding protein 1